MHVAPRPSGPHHTLNAEVCTDCFIAPHDAAIVAHHWIRFLTATALVFTLVIATSVASERPPTGTSRGSEQLDALIKEKKYPELLTALKNPPGLKTQDYAFFAGVLANHTNHLSTSIRLLKQALPMLQKQGARDREQVALETLADGYSRLYRYSEAADTYAILEKRLGDQMSAEERANVEHVALQWGLLRHVPPQSVSVSAAHGSDKA